MSERLTYFDGRSYQPISSKVECVQRLGELEDLQERRLLVELPCKTGGFVYIVDNGQIHRCIVENRFVTKGLMARVLGVNKDICHVVYKEDIGKTVFLTKAEAQAALERMEG